MARYVRLVSGSRWPTEPKSSGFARPCHALAPEIVTVYVLASPIIQQERRSPMPDRTIVVFTYRSRSMMLQEGGSQAWALKPASARRCKYIVCTRNRYFAGAEPEEQAAATEEHGAAFLVGKVTAVEPWPGRDEKARYIIRFDQYAVLPDPVKDVWPGHQNPIWYVEDIRKLDIDPDKLNWQPMPESADRALEKKANMNATPDGLTFDQARAGLATMYRVPPGSIEIVIRG